MPKNLTIDEMFAFVAIDENGDEGIIGAPVLGMMMPLVGADIARIESLAKLASKVGSLTDTKVKLIHFSVRKELDINDYVE